MFERWEVMTRRQGTFKLADMPATATIGHSDAKAGKVLLPARITSSDVTISMHQPAADEENQGEIKLMFS